MSEQEEAVDKAARQEEQEARPAECVVRYKPAYRQADGGDDKQETYRNQAVGCYFQLGRRSCDGQSQVHFIPVCQEGDASHASK